jgi:hypothetical protein
MSTFGPWADFLRPSMNAEAVARFLDRLTRGFIYSSAAFCAISTPFLIGGYIQKYRRLSQNRSLSANLDDTNSRIRDK